MITFIIDGKTVTAKKGQTIIDVARNEGMYIPTMCYLEKTTPCASCRLCSVEVEGVEGLILSCNTPPTQGIVVHTQSDRLHKERTNIMKLYDVNHPLECGVCDKSGACDLQNKTLEFGVAQQAFTARDQSRKIEHWGLINYDPNLCILCEKCVHVCNEIIGDDAIELKFGGYNSSVIPKNSDTLDCTNCGECIAVCPVGALVSSDFQYRANAWELERIPSTCAHCSAGCALEYEVKHTSINTMSATSIYRVTNNYEFTTLCGAGRFGFDFQNEAQGQDAAAFKRVIEALKKASSIAFTSTITNEEALMLQTLKEKLGIKLFNEDARSFQSFLKAFSKASGRSIYSAKLEDVAQSDQVVVLGSRIATDNPQVRYHITMASKRNKARVTYMHPIEDALLQNSVTQFVKYEVGTEEGVMAMLAQTLLGSHTIDSDIQAYFDAIDTGYVCAETNVGEEEFARIAKERVRAKKTTVILGQDLYMHENAANIATLAGLIERFTDIKVLMVPAQVNTLGVALICDLDRAQDKASVGYWAEGEVVLGNLESHLPMPALNQQEGTVTSIDKKVLPLNVALSFTGYTLLDVCRQLDVTDASQTIAFTAALPVEKGFQAVCFDALENFLSARGEDIRGYELHSQTCDFDVSLSAIENLPVFDGTIVYQSNPVLQFNVHTAKAKGLKDQAQLRGSAQFAMAAKIAHGDRVIIDFGYKQVERTFELDETLKGTIALHPTFDLGYDAMPKAYRFDKVKISKGQKL